ncbi:MAG: TIM barrel protein [Firmicutes bacterium]|nr:TIM barrel protein [Bacillota bacterium]
MRVGTAPITWGVCEIPGWGPQLPYSRVLDEMAAAGYAGTELGPEGYFPRDPDRLRDELDRRGLAMIAAFVPVNLRDPEAVDRSLAAVDDTARLLARLGAACIVLADDGDAARQQVAGRVQLTETHGLSASQWRTMAGALHQAADRAADLGIAVCVHPHGGTYIENPAEIRRLMESTDPSRIRLCLDTGHIAFGGGDPLALARKYAGRIGLVHLKDIALDRLRQGVAQGHGYTRMAQEGVFVELGTGSLDLKSIVGELDAAGYEGWLVVEQDRVVKPDDDTLGVARRNRRYLREALNL